MYSSYVNVLQENNIDFNGMTANEALSRLNGLLFDVGVAESYLEDQEIEKLEETLNNIANEALTGSKTKHVDLIPFVLDLATIKNRLKDIRETLEFCHSTDDFIKVALLALQGAPF